MVRKLLATFVLLAASAAQAQYPEKTVRVVVPFPPGGQTDIVGRIMADQFTKLWGRTAIVENKIGASGTVGSEMVAKSPPDGHTFVIVFDTHAVNPSLLPNIQAILGHATPEQTLDYMDLTDAYSAEAFVRKMERQEPTQLRAVK